MRVSRKGMLTMQIRLKYRLVGFNFRILGGSMVVRHQRGFVSFDLSSRRANNNFFFLFSFCCNSIEIYMMERWFRILYILIIFIRECWIRIFFLYIILSFFCQYVQLPSFKCHTSIYINVLKDIRARAACAIVLTRRSLWRLDDERNKIVLKMLLSYIL